jgi:hypothetical protein
VTIIFLPLNFVSSFFGMNVSDIREMPQTQWLFWAVALCVTAAVVGGSLFLAFEGGTMAERWALWRDIRRERRLTRRTASRQQGVGGEREFRVVGMERIEGFNPY